VNRKTGLKRQIFKEWGVEINPGSMDLPARRINPGNMLMGNSLKLDLASPQTNLDRQT
jgi:aubergine-like protein